MTVPLVPLDYANQQPDGDLASALSLFRLLQYSLERGADSGLSKETCHDLGVLLFEATEMLEPIQVFLDVLDYPTLIEDYRTARASHIEKRASGVSP